jgi:hypothetical protein
MACTTDQAINVKGGVGCIMGNPRSARHLAHGKTLSNESNTGIKEDLAHLPAWAQFRRNIGNSGDVGIWHETYLIAPGQYENIYHNMPTFGLGQASQLVEASGRLESAEGRVSPVTGHSRADQESPPVKIE